MHATFVQTCGESKSRYCNVYTLEILPYMAVLKVSIELRTLAVLWTHFCVDRTADLSSFMDTFSMFKKLPDLGSFMDTFQSQ